MPNTPALIGAGITGLYAPPGRERGRARAAPKRPGARSARRVWVDDEALLDAVTAVSGSGPAYVFCFIEALEQAARELGLDAGDDARRLALQTFARRRAARRAIERDRPRRCASG